MPVEYSQVAELFQGIGLEIARDRYERINDYINLLLARNKQVNLTAIREEGEIWRKHVLDSLLLFCALEIPAGSKIVDVGTGAGIPGLIVKLYRPDLRITLLEAQQKKVKFLAEVTTGLNLQGVTCLWGRAEEIGHQVEYRETFDLALARGVAALNILAEYCLPLVNRGGSMAAYKGPAAEQELAAAQKAIALLGGGPVEVWQGQLPGGDEIRSLVIINKSGPTPAGYPRRPGVPTRRPLSLGK